MKNKGLYILLFSLLFSVINLHAEEVEIYPDRNISVLKNPVCFSGDNEFVFASFGTNSLYKIHVIDGNVDCVISNIGEYFEDENLAGNSIIVLDISDDNKYLAVVSGKSDGSVSLSSRDSYLCIFELTTMDLIYKEKIFNDYIQRFISKIFLDDSHSIMFTMPTKIADWILGKYYSEINLIVYDLDSKKRTTEILHEINGVGFYDIAINKEKNNFVISYNPEVFEVFNENGNLIKRIPKTSGVFYNFTPDGKFLFNEKGDIWDAKSYRFIKSTNKNFGYTISSDKKYMSIGYMLYSLNEKDFGEKVSYLNITEPSMDFSLSENQKYIAFGSQNGTVSIYKAIYTKINESGDKLDYLLKVSMFDNSEWVSITPDGYYNASVEGDTHINIRYGLNTFGLNQFSKSYFHPEVIEARVLEKKDPNVVSYFGEFKLNAAPPLVKIEENQNENIANLKITVIDPVLKYPLEGIQIYINGKMLGSQELSKYNGENITVINTALISLEKQNNTIVFQIPVELENGENLIEVLAENEACYGISSVTLNCKKAKEKKPDLWIYAIGINDYENLPQRRSKNDSGLIDLKNAVTDSNKMISVFKAQEGKKYGKVYVNQISDMSLLKPTKENIKENMSFFDKMTSNDVAIFFIAAHGVSVDGNFYILPADVHVDDTGLKPKLNECLNVDDLLNVTNINGRKIFLIDTCQSGGIDNNIVVKTLKNRGTVIFTAARELEYAQESGDVGGHFTYSIVNCLLENKNSDVTISTLAGFVDDEVKQLSKFGGRGKIRQHPVLLIPEGMRNYIIAK